MDYKTTMKTIRGGTGAKESVQEIGYDKARNRFTSRKREKAIW